MTETRVIYGIATDPATERSVPPNTLIAAFMIHLYYSESEAREAADKMAARWGGTWRVVEEQP